MPFVGLSPTFDCSAGEHCYSGLVQLLVSGISRLSHQTDGARRLHFQITDGARRLHFQIDVHKPYVVLTRVPLGPVLDPLSARLGAYGESQGMIPLPSLSSLTINARIREQWSQTSTRFTKKEPFRSALCHLFSDL